MSFCPPWICKSQPIVVHMAALQHQVPGVGRIHLCPSWWGNVDFQGGWGFHIQKCRVGFLEPTHKPYQNNGLDKGNNNLKSWLYTKKSGGNDTGEWLKKIVFRGQGLTALFFWCWWRHRGKWMIFMSISRLGSKVIGSMGYKPNICHL